MNSLLNVNYDGAESGLVSFFVIECFDSKLVIQLAKHQIRS